MASVGGRAGPGPVRTSGRVVDVELCVVVLEVVVATTSVRRDTYTVTAMTTTSAMVTVPIENACAVRRRRARRPIRSSVTSAADCDGGTRAARRASAARTSSTDIPFLLHHRFAETFERRV